MLKEIRQMRRDRLTFGMIFGMPIIQLLLFGFAINGDPRHLPLALEVNDTSVFSRSIDAALRTSSYFDVTHVVSNHAQADDLLRRGDVQMVVTIPVGFARDLVRGHHPVLLISADASDPAATGNALAAVSQAVQSGLAHDLIGPLAPLQAATPVVDVRLHRSYNPEGITSHNIVPGLLAIVLTMTLVMIAGMAVTRERERGTMENLLAMPLRPIEVMIGKIAPYLLIGMVQTVVILLFAKLIFGVPFVGSVALMMGATLLFIAVSLALGFTFSTIAETQLQAMQMSFFYILPSMLLSGFMFPFRGQPGWAQAIGEVVPVTHFLRIVRGVMLKGWDFGTALPEMAVLAAMLLVLGTIAISRYRDTIG
jgi:ABC-2 type transport system permease protein